MFNKIKMRYSTESKEQKYITRHEFLLFVKRPVRRFGYRYGKKLIGTARKTFKNIGMNAAKTVSKRVDQKTAEATGDLIGNELVDKITSAGKPKSKESKQSNVINGTQKIYITPEKCKKFWLTLI